MINKLVQASFSMYHWIWREEKQIILEWIEGNPFQYTTDDMQQAYHILILWITKMRISILILPEDMDENS